MSDRSEPEGPGVSGKLVIIAIFVAAISAAAAGWFFRYNATHRSVQFWGPEAAQLIRDASTVVLYKQPTIPTDSLGVDLADTDAVVAAIQKHTDESAIDVSKAPGLLHLRHALLEDSSFIWSPKAKNTPEDLDTTKTGYWWLKFENSVNSKSTTIWFTKDCRQALRLLPDPNRRGTFQTTAISTDPIATGLHEVFVEMSSALPKDKPVSRQ